MFFIPIILTDEDKTAYRYDGGAKRMSVLGFLPLAKLQRQLVLGDGCMTFQPVADDESSVMALSSLAYAMYESGQVALIRRVYRANSTPRMGALIPEFVTDDDGNSSLVCGMFSDCRHSK